MALTMQKLTGKTRPKGEHAGQSSLPLHEGHSNPRRPHSGAFGLIEGGPSARGPLHAAASSAYMNMTGRGVMPSGPPHGMTRISRGPVNTMSMHNCPYCGQPLP